VHREGTQTRGRAGGDSGAGARCTVGAHAAPHDNCGSRHHDQDETESD